MTITLEIPDETLAALLTEARVYGKDASTLAVETLRERYNRESIDVAEAQRWWDGLSNDEKIRCAALSYRYGSSNESGRH